MSDDATKPRSNTTDNRPVPPPRNFKRKERPAPILIQHGTLELGEFEYQTTNQSPREEDSDLDSSSDSLVLNNESSANEITVAGQGGSLIARSRQASSVQTNQNCGTPEEAVNNGATWCKPPLPPSSSKPRQTFGHQQTPIIGAHVNEPPSPRELASAMVPPPIPPFPSVLPPLNLMPSPSSSPRSPSASCGSGIALRQGHASVPVPQQMSDSPRSLVGSSISLYSPSPSSSLPSTASGSSYASASASSRRGTSSPFFQLHSGVCIGEI